MRNVVPTSHNKKSMGKQGCAFVETVQSSLGLRREEKSGMHACRADVRTYDIRSCVCASDELEMLVAYALDLVGNNAMLGYVRLPLV